MISNWSLTPQLARLDGRQAMTFRILLTKPEGEHMEEFPLSSLIAAQAFVYNFSPMLSQKREEARLPE